MRTKMKMMIAVLAMCIVFTNCKKEAGPKGEKGDKGDNGQNGSTSSGIICNTYTVNSWTWDNSAKMNYTFLPVTNLTQNIVNNGAVMVYESIASGGNWMPLPETLSWGSAVTLQTTFQYDVNSLLLMQYLTDQSTFSPTGSSVWKVVIIPPAMVKPDVNIKDFSEVKEAYSLKD